MSTGGYESWFVSARDPASRRALWIRHTQHRPRQGPESMALWCTVVDHDLAQRPAVLYRAPLPRTKLESTVPDGLVTGMLSVDGQTISVSEWRGTVGHNWGSEHADSWVWLHAAGFGGAPDNWLELVLARMSTAPVRACPGLCRNRCPRAEPRSHSRLAATVGHEPQAA